MPSNLTTRETVLALTYLTTGIAPNVGLYQVLEDITVSGGASTLATVLTNTDLYKTSYLGQATSDQDFATRFTEKLLSLGDNYFKSAPADNSYVGVRDLFANILAGGTGRPDLIALGVRALDEYGDVPILTRAKLVQDTAIMIADRYIQFGGAGDSIADLKAVMTDVILVADHPESMTKAFEDLAKLTSDQAGFTPPVSGTASTGPAMANPTFGGLTSLIQFGHDISGVASATMALTGGAAWANAFDPRKFTGWEDGVFTTAELGFSHLGPLPATSAALQSIVVGFAESLVLNLDYDEYVAMHTFMVAHPDLNAATPPGQPTIKQQYIDLLIGIAQTPTSSPVFDTAPGPYSAANFIARDLAGLVQHFDYPSVTIDPETHVEIPCATVSLFDFTSFGFL